MSAQSIPRRAIMATRAAVGTWKRVFQDPSGKGQAYQRMQEWYGYLWSLHENSVYDGFRSAVAYRVNYNLYRNIRGLYNPARRLADFYAGFVYPGPLDDAIPIESDNEALLPAIQQVWQWSNWLDGKSVFVRYGASLGDVLVAVVDDMERRKVYLDIVWPGQIAALDLDSQGNVKRYLQEYAADENGREYKYGKEVTPEAITTFRDDKPFSYQPGQEATVPNPYGFVPAAWARHRNVGSDHGEPAIAACYQKVDELNQLASALNDRVMKIVNSPLIVDAEGKLPNERGKRPPTADQASPERDKDSLGLWRVPQGSGIHMLELQIADAYPALDKQIAEIEKDLPELTVHAQLREMSQVTGPAAARIMGDAVNRLSDAAAGYDQQSVKLFQMAVAIAGWRAQSGAWGSKGELGAQRAKFAPFSLDSYERGDIDMAIAPRPLIRETGQESAQTLLLKQQLGVSEKQILTELGYSDEQVQAMIAEKREAQEAMGSKLLAAFDRGQA
jgi:hypothetical protein